MQIDLQRFHATFFDETAEHLATMEEALLSLEQSPDDRELLGSIFRAAHSIKGASGTFGFGQIAGFTHRMESLLDRMRNGEVHTDADLVALLLRSADVLSALLAAAKDGAPLPPELEEIVQSLERAQAASQLAGGVPAPAAEAQTASLAREVATGARQYAVTFAPGLDLLRHGMDPLLLLRDLSQLGEIVEVTVDASRMPHLADLVPDECHLAWSIRLKTDKPQEEIQGVFIFVEDCSRIGVQEETVCAESGEAPNTAAAAAPDSSASGRSEQPAVDGPQVAAQEARSQDERPPAKAPAAAPKGRHTECSSIRVSVEKVDDLINLVGELVIAQSMINQVLGQVATDQLPAVQEALSAMNRSTRDLQDRVMSVRMIPLASVFRRFPRLVHDLAAGLGKQVNVEISGEDTELDKQMTEQLGDPLTHLIRNAVDHGVEPPEERKQAGKPAQGNIGLRAYHEGGNVVIEVSDDGRGLDRERIRRKAVEMGLVGHDEQLNDEQVFGLIMAPGFSTAQQVTDVSGRGVGMDVVKRNIEALNGSVSITSRPGRGSTFRLRLPLTMAILDGLSLGLNGEIYIVPLLSVVESFRPKPGDVKTVAGRGEVILVRGRPVPMLRLHRAFHTQARATDPTQGLVVILEHQGKHLGLLVDELLGQMQVVMKSLEANYQKVEGLSGATILGDGQVAFILDVPGLTRLARRTSSRPAEQDESGLTPPSRLPEETEEGRAVAIAAPPR